MVICKICRLQFSGRPWLMCPHALEAVYNMPFVRLFKLMLKVCALYLRKKIVVVSVINVASLKKC